MEKWTAVIEHDGDWWIGSVEELPAADAQGATLKEACQDLKAATRLVIRAVQRLNQRGSAVCD